MKLYISKSKTDILIDNISLANYKALSYQKPITVTVASLSNIIGDELSFSHSIDDKVDIVKNTASTSKRALLNGITGFAIRKRAGCNDRFIGRRKDVSLLP